MDRKRVVLAGCFLALAFLLYFLAPDVLFAPPTYERCPAEWICLDRDTRAYQGAECYIQDSRTGDFQKQFNGCSVSRVQDCGGPCVNGECLVCGNAVLNVGEECDDGNLGDGDGCSSLCVDEISEFPIGIPEPSFGVFETIENVYGEEYFTHYVDNSVLCSDTSTGTPDNPRCTIPQNLQAGSVVKVAGGPYIITNANLRGFGTEEQPVFLSGVSNGENLPEIIHATSAKIFDGTFFVVENFKFDRVNFAPSSHHAVLRNSEVYGYSNKNCVEVKGQDIVVYKNYIHNAGGGIPLSDDHGVTAGFGAERVWILENEIAYNTGDGIQFCHGCAEPGPRYIFIGRNKIHHNTENAVDFKTSRDVVVSQNLLYGHTSSDGSDGTAFLVGSNGLEDPAVNIWGIFNDIYDNDGGIRVESAATSEMVSGPAHFIGNKIHNIQRDAFRFEKNGQPIFIIGNTIYDADNALNADWQHDFSLKVYNNIFANLRGIRFGNHVNIQSSQISAASELKNNLFYQDGQPLVLRWGGATYTFDNSAELGSFSGGEDNLLENPLFVDVDGEDGVSGNWDDNFHLSSGNPAMDTGRGDLYDYSIQFCNVFGEMLPNCVEKIKVDFDDKVRPQGAEWDRGLYEFS